MQKGGMRKGEESGFSELVARESGQPEQHRWWINPFPWLWFQTPCWMPFIPVGERKERE